MMQPETVTLRGEPELAVDIYEASNPQGAGIWIHGFASRRNGDKVRYAGPKIVAAGYTLIAPDLQGHGDSGGDFAGLTIKRSIEDVRRVSALPQFAEAPRRALIGSSFGALVAAWVAVDHPELCDAVILLAPAFRFVERHAAALPPDRLAAWRRGEPLSVRNEWADVELSNAILKEAPDRTVEELALRLDKPTLVLHGRRDQSVPVEESIHFAELCPRAQLEIFEEGDHRLTDHKESVLARMFQFVGR